MAQAMVGFTPPNGLDLVVEGLDPEVIGREAVLEVAHVASVKDDRPVDAREVRWSQAITLDSTDLILPITLDRPARYRYDGEQLAIELEVVLKFPKKGWFSSDDILARATVPLPQVVHEGTHRSRELVQPRDDYSLERAFGSLGPEAGRQVAIRAAIYAAAVLGIGAGAFWTGWCVLQFFWLIGSLIGAKVLYDHVMKELAGYAQLAFGFVPPLGPDRVVPIGQLLDGLPRLDVERPRLRIVACNLERGQYKRGSGTDVRTVSFAEPVGTMVLYDMEIVRWPRGTPLADAFDGEVDFGPAFAALAPPDPVGEEHGLGFRWEAQLIVPDLVDVEVEGPTEVWHWPADWRPE